MQSPICVLEKAVIHWKWRFLYNFFVADIMDSTNKKIFTEKDQFLTPTCPEKANAEELPGL